LRDGTSCGGTDVGVHVTALSQDMARRHATRLAELLSGIPGVSWSPGDVVASRKGDLVLEGRWQHSFVALDRALGPVGVLLSHERPAEPASPETFDEVVYPASSFYLAGLAVDPALQRAGIGSQLLQHWFASTTRAGLSIAADPLAWSLQTNAAPSNAGVRSLYGRFGFGVVGAKVYPNRTDVVMWRHADAGDPPIRPRRLRSTARRR
jgi:ribosomal protein S18 acetylase RimI-like enzyme